ncbi:Uu.00g015900.m01.CDS01 [Anthostomella pinea]|uniref:Uu.00g015900.m01.CDS01 n=1 Tax=Anthostomella pinea TaxID=933095 RepID=A0AAI8VYM5_9PEZI|nr:Uu.00g015900.m01.CDS01 [Anthostomella pinea]
MATFDDAALSKLTAKIDSGLANSKKTTDDKNGNAKPKRKLDQSADAFQPPSKKRSQTVKEDGKPFEKQTGKPTAKPTAKSPGKQTDKPNGKYNDESKGKFNDKPKDKYNDKRKEKYNEKPHGKYSEKPNGKRHEKQPGKPSDHRPKPAAKEQPDLQPSDSNTLLDEIRALGGDEEDYKLLEDVDSDDEVPNDQDGKKSTDKDLRAELAKFASGLGFDDVTPASADEESDANMDEVVSDGAESGQEVDEKPIPDPKRKTIFEPRPDWHAVSLRPLPEPTSDQVAPYTAAIASLKDYATTILNEDTDAYGTTFAASSSRKFMSTIMSSGTMSDKVSALTLAIQESPVHSTKAFENLLSLGAKRSRGPALSALAALVDLLGPGMILPSDRRLRIFATQPGLIGTLQKFSVKSWTAGKGLPGKITKEQLIAWVFEDWLKDAYFKMIQSLETWCDDEVEYARTKAVDLVFALLRDKPEQESNLLRLLVNKLGDRDRKIASRASYLLLQLLNTHPAMKPVVVRSVEQDVIFRPGQNIRAKYYAVNTLNQTILSTKEPEIADSLLRIYFGMFVSLLKSGELSQFNADPEVSKPSKRKHDRRKPDQPKGGDDKSQTAPGDGDAAEKLVSAVLTGVNRAVPFSQADQSTLESHLDTLFRITHSSNFNTSIQALMLIQQLSANRHLATERFYRTLYESLLDPRLVTSSKQYLYLNLLYRSLKADIDVRRVKAFVKRMLQVLNLHQPSFVCGILYLATELCGAFPDIKTLLSEPEEHDAEETGMPTASDAPVTTAVDGPDTQIFRNDKTYDGRKRAPEYSNAHLSCLWELVPFLRHFHPSVDVFASTLLSGQKAAQKPELASHTLIAFLDKFVYKNAKATDTTKGVSIMQPVVASGQSHILLSSKPSAKEAGSSLNSASFWNKKSEDVAVDDVFFHEYFSRIGKQEQVEREKKMKAKKETGEEAEAEEADEEEIWDALVNSHPEIQEESDSDSGFEDLMDLDGSDDDLDDDVAQEDGEEVSEDDELDFLDESDLDSGEDEEDEDEELQPAAGKAEDKKTNAERRARKKAMKNLPTFASAEDYAEMLAQDEDGM